MLPGITKENGHADVLNMVPATEPLESPNQQVESFSQIDLLTNPHPRRHIVYGYNDEEKGINAVYLFASSGLSKGESVVLVMADSRCEPIARRLAQEGLDVSTLQSSGRLKCVSADSMLDMFMATGALDDRLMKDTLISVIAEARTHSLNGKVRVFGEMVSLLFARNEVTVAERVERLWNEVIETESISLLCSYRLIDSHQKTLPESLALLHSHNLAAGRDTDLNSQWK